MSNIYYKRFAYALPTPTGLTVTFYGVPGATIYSYRVAALSLNGTTLACTAVTVGSANASLSISNYNRVSWTAVDGAYGYKIYGRTSGSELLLHTLTNGSNYWDDTGTAVPSDPVPVANTTGKTNWDEMLFRGGYIMQSCEGNDLNAMLADQTTRVSNTLYEEGQVISGCTTSIASNILSITAGEIYIEGKIRDVDAGSVAITGSGTEYVGLLVTATVVTEVEDPTLRDPAVGRLNYGSSGAHRKVYTLVWSHDPAAVTVFTIIDGVVQPPTLGYLFKEKVSGVDTTPNYLQSKLTAGTGITLTKQNSGANENILIASSAQADTVVTETSFGQASTAGIASTVSRSDHTHGTPTWPSNQIRLPYFPTLLQAGTIDGFTPVLVTSFFTFTPWYATSGTVTATVNVNISVTNYPSNPSWLIGTRFELYNLTDNDVVTGWDYSETISAGSPIGGTPNSISYTELGPGYMRTDYVYSGIPYICSYTKAFTTDVALGVEKTYVFRGYMTSSWPGHAMNGTLSAPVVILPTQVT